MEAQQRAFVRSEMIRAGYEPGVAARVASATSVAEILMILSGIIGEQVSYGVRFPVGNNFVVTMYKGSSIPDIVQH